MVKRINKNITKPKHNTLDYSKEYEVSPLKLLVIIVNKYQGDYYLDLLIKKHNVAAAFLCLWTVVCNVRIPFRRLRLPLPGSQRLCIWHRIALQPAAYNLPICRICRDSPLSKLHKTCSVPFFLLLNGTKV